MSASKRVRKVTYEGLSNGLLFCPNFSMCRGEGVNFERDASGAWNNGELLALVGRQGRRFIEALQAMVAVNKILLESRELYVWRGYSSHVQSAEASAEEMLALLEAVTRAVRLHYGVQAVNITAEPQFRLFESVVNPSQSTKTS